MAGHLPEAIEHIIRQNEVAQMTPLPGVEQVDEWYEVTDSVLKCSVFTGSEPDVIPEDASNYDW